MIQTVQSLQQYIADTHGNIGVNTTLKKYSFICIFHYYLLYHTALELVKVLILSLVRV